LFFTSDSFFQLTSILKMSLTATLNPFSCERYNIQPHIDEAQHLSLEEHTNNVKKVLFKHFMTDVAGLCRTHKHMDLVPNERIVAFADTVLNKIVINYQVFSEQELKAADEYLIPFQFLYEQSARGWVPLAYWDGRKHGGEAMRVALKRVLAAPDFLIDMAKSLEAIPELPSCAIGVCLRFQHLILGSELGLLETTDVDKRTQWLRVCGPSKDSITTHWYWDITDDCIEGKKGRCCCRQHKSRCRISCDAGIDGGRHQKVHFTL